MTDREMQAPTALENDLKELQEAAQVIAAVRNIAERNIRMRNLLTRMLDSEDLGHAMTNEVRDIIRAEIQKGWQ